MPYAAWRVRRAWRAKIARPHPRSQRAARALGVCAERAWGCEARASVAASRVLSGRDWGGWLIGCVPDVCAAGGGVSRPRRAAARYLGRHDPRLQVRDRRKSRGGEHATHFRISEPRGGFPGKLRTSPGAPRHARSAPPLRRPVRLFPRGFLLLPRRCAHGVAACESSAGVTHQDVSAGERGGLAEI